ncbi:MAG: IclR family transcriptional regulator C-terminal domain-containing protein [Haloglomus sp.]
MDRYGLPAKTEHTITDEDELFAELERIREQGYALSVEESLYGFHAVSAPVLTQSSRPVAAVIIAGAASRMDPETCRNELADAARSAANEIGLDLQYD